MEDLYYSKRTPDGWDTPRNLGAPINSEGNEGFPSFSPDGRYFFFASDRHGEESDWSIYIVDAAVVLDMLD